MIYVLDRSGECIAYSHDRSRLERLKAYLESQDDGWDTFMIFEAKPMTQFMESESIEIPLEFNPEPQLPELTNATFD